MPDGYDEGGMMYFEGPYGPEPVDWLTPEDRPTHDELWNDRFFMEEARPDYDELMTQYDNEVDEYTAEESWS